MNAHKRQAEREKKNSVSPLRGLEDEEGELCTWF